MNPPHPPWSGRSTCGDRMADICWFSSPPPPHRRGDISPQPETDESGSAGLQPTAAITHSVAVAFRYIDQWHRQGTKKDKNALWCLWQVWGGTRGARRWGRGKERRSGKDKTGFVSRMRFSIKPEKKKKPKDFERMREREIGGRTEVKRGSEGKLPLEEGIEVG